MNPQSKPAAVILAAGASSRMGHPKPLLVLEDETFLDRLIARFSGLCTPLCVVLGYHAAAVRAGTKRAAEAEFTVNPESERGMLSSLQCGLAHVAGASAVLFTPVDLPAIKRSTIAAIAACDSAIAIARHAGRNGHPVRVSREIAAELLALPVGAQARDVLHRHREATMFVDVDDPGILHDIDTPAEYEALLAAREGGA